MAVDTPHDDYSLIAPEWEKVETCIEGAPAIKRAGPKYLRSPDFKENAAKKYADYLAGALYWNAVKIAKLGFRGLVLRKPTKLEVDDSILTETEREEFECDVTGTRVNFSVHAASVLDKVIAPGRIGILIDAPEGSEKATQKLYPARSIIDWHEEYIDGQKVPLEVRLLEERTERNPETFARKTFARIRVIQLLNVFDDAGDPLPPEGRVLIHRIFEEQQPTDQKKAGSKTKFVELEDERRMPLRRRRPIPFLPFTAVNQSHVGYDVEPPQLADLCDVLLSQLKNSADLERSLSLMVPTVVIRGVNVQKDVVELGGTIGLTNPESDAKILQGAAQELLGYERAIARKDDMARQLAARVLERRNVAAEKPEAIKLQQESESSILAGMVTNTNDGLSEATAQQIWWRNGAADFKELDRYRKSIRASLNDDLQTLTMSAQEASTWTEVELSGGMSQMVRLKLFERAGLYPEGHTAEDEQRAIADDLRSRGSDEADPVEAE